MSTSVSGQPGPRKRRPRVIGRLSTETKQAFKTTEFWAAAIAIVAILIASAVIGADPDGGRDHDAFPAQRAWLYVAIVVVGYLVSRGLAKSGSREPYWADEDDLPNR